MIFIVYIEHVPGSYKLKWSWWWWCNMFCVGWELLF